MYCGLDVNLLTTLSKDVDTKITQASQKAEQEFDKLSKDVDTKITQASQKAEQEYLGQKINLDMLSHDIDNKYKIVQGELIKMQNENAILSKALTRAKGIMIVSIVTFAISIVTFIMLLEALLG